MQTTPLIQLVSDALKPFRMAEGNRTHEWSGTDYSSGTEPEAFVRFLSSNGLAPLWFDHIHRSGSAGSYPASFVEPLRTATIKATIAQAQQTAILRETIQYLQEAEVPVLAIKGAVLRLCLYERPELRPSLDIDLLVPPEYRKRATCLFTRNGMQSEVEPASIDHELAFLHKGVAIDLHWDVFRAGRSEPGLIAELFERQTTVDGIPIPDQNHNFYLMLTHPVITNYPLSELSVVRLVDIDRWVRNNNPDWDQIAALTHRYRTRTAAWLSLVLVQRFLGTPVPATAIRSLHPGAIRSRYLRLWVEKDLSTRLRGSPRARQFLYSLPLHDSLLNAAKDSLSYLKSRNASAPAVASFERLIRRCGPKELREHKK